MTEKHKAQFELLNNSLWVLLKQYVKDDKPYKAIMSELFLLYVKKDTDKNKFTDEWWESLRDIYDCVDKYKVNQEVCGFGAEMALCLQQYFELEARKAASLLDFYKEISPAFIGEWERLKGYGKSDSE